MTKPILAGYDSRDDDRSPVEFGAAAAQFTGAPLIVAGVHAGDAGLGEYGHGLVEDKLGDESGLTLGHGAPYPVAVVPRGRQPGGHCPVIVLARGTEAGLEALIA